MSKITRILAIFALLSLVQNYYTSAALRSYTNFHNYPQKGVKFNRNSFDEGNLVYAVCDGSVKQTNCAIIQERYPDGKSQRSCNVTLTVDQPNANVTGSMYVAAFGRNKAMLFWSEVAPKTSVFKHLTVNMDNCDTGGFALLDPTMKMHYQLFPAKIATYDDSFEMFIRKLDETIDIVSVMTVGSRGSIEKNATEFIKIGGADLRFIAPIDVDSPRKSYAYAKHSHDKYVLAIRKADGSDKVLTSHDRKFFTDASVNNGLIALYVRRNTTTTCTQYNRKGNVLFKVTFDGDSFRKRVSSRGMYNLPGGGILVLLAEYVASEEYNPVAGYSVVKINREGKKVGSIRLNDELIDAHNKATKSVSTYVWENGNEVYCAAEVVLGIVRVKREDEPSDINVVVNCFTEADLVP